ncbi:protein CUSTOS-like isoform X2 [Microcebus murinus]|uniref:protein CUSTOS-like isoform X2 n=1 Tax=Microcebus murinus TaxID=30608 RepID=UPI00098A16F7|nr:uncharacterized protein C12orf43-like isoform X2 [Microcebus murinus]
MAALNGAMRDSDNSSSSSDMEELARCREAAMPAWGLEQRPRGPEEPGAGTARSRLAASHPSLRLKVDEHEPDGNEPQTSPEFRAHVAKKLGAVLDSIIAIAEAVKEPRKAEVQKVTSEDDGPEKEASPKRHRKRQPSSSSGEDSDEDILQESALRGPVAVEKEAGRKKKKKKAKKVASVDSAAATSTGAASRATGRKQEKEPGELSGDHVSLGTKKKKREKKARKAGEPSPVPPAKNAAAEPAN